MAEEGSDGGGSSLLNPNSILALVTLFGGLLFVSVKLTSNRPVLPAGASQLSIGDQKLEARLWEDPLKKTDRNDLGKGSPPELDNLAVLARPIKERSETGKPVLLLPVMVGGGNFAEDQESRLRSRYAIVSALGRSGFVPDDAEHIGRLSIPWQSQSQLNVIKRSQAWFPQLFRNTVLTQAQESPATQLDLSFEWYHSRVFSQGTKEFSAVLVLWLNEDFFDDEPLLRLPRLFEPLLDATKGSVEPKIALIGPRGSDALRAMIRTKKNPMRWRDDNSDLWSFAKRILGKIDLYCATPSAMDEVLVTDADPGSPRSAVGCDLTCEAGFHSFQNFAVTGTQLAEELYEELKLRGASLTNADNHVVLISEWDTFYGRTLSLAYEAKLFALQNCGLSNFVPNLVDYYITNADGGIPKTPPNFHSFVYLRGLDGQTVRSEQASEKSREDRHKSRPGSVDEIRTWEPEGNKAEGLSQFDYLNRISNQIDELEERLHRENRGHHIRAIGIVGSDVYDILLILQGLRERFKDLLFFTTDLDARFIEPRERKWARNLIVVSAYGLTLHPDFQSDIAPFRDSTQTAQFAAALAALGDNKLSNLLLKPRRFEIGNSTAVDLSVTNVSTHTNVYLHPLTINETHKTISKHSVPIVLIVLAIIGWISSQWEPVKELICGVSPDREKSLSDVEDQHTEQLARALSQRDGGWCRADHLIEADNRLKSEVRKIQSLWRLRVSLFRGVAAVFIGASTWLAWTIWRETFSTATGQGFSLVNGTSAWPAEILRLLVIAAGLWLCLDLRFKVREMFFSLTRQYHFLPETLLDPSGAEELWQQYRAEKIWWGRSWKILGAVVLYLGLFVFVFLNSDQRPLRPVRGTTQLLWDSWLLSLAAITFLVLTFFTIFTVLRCRDFIRQLSASKIGYSLPAIEHFREKNGRIDSWYLKEWIDLALISDVTDRVGKLVYYPCSLILLLFLARNSWWDAWTWPPILIVIFFSNFGLAIASVLILQQAAKDAQKDGTKSLTAKVKELRAFNKTPQENNADQAEAILQEIRDLKSGGFVPFWQSHTVGAFFLSSGGITIIQLLIWFMER